MSHSRHPQYIYHPPHPQHNKLSQVLMRCAWTRLISMLLPKLKCLLIADKVTRQIANCRIRFQFVGTAEVQKQHLLSLEYLICADWWRWNEEKKRENSNFYKSLLQTAASLWALWTQNSVNRLRDFNRNHIKYADDVLSNTQYNLQEE